MKAYLLDERIAAEVNGDTQYLHIRTNCPSAPIVLFVHGGPGVPDRSWVMPMQSGYLADAAVMVCWDQRMAGKSYRKDHADRKMTLQQQADDMHAVIQYLLARFHRRHVCIVGHSWGSILSCLYLPQHPETVSAYVGMGQFVDGWENERLSYQFVLDYAQQHHDQKALRDLTAIGSPVKGMYAGGFDALMVQRNYMTRFGGGCYREKESIFRSVLVPFLTSGEYSLIPDLYRYAKGSSYCVQQLWPEIINLNFNQSFTETPVPVFLFQGDHDQNTPVALSRPWFDALKAPYKEWVPFHESAHSPIKEEPERWGSLLKEKVLSRIED
jgi:pimeloyl-ACP methyl ester carboxylesterase